VNGLRLLINVSPTTIPAGMNGTVTATLRNVGDTTRTVTLATGCASLIRLFKYPGSEPVPLNVICVLVAVPVTLEPDQEYTQTHLVGSGSSTLPQTLLQPGEYYAVAAFEEPDAPDLRSNSVRFTVQ
jgi:hypothetical protein